MIGLINNLCLCVRTSVFILRVFHRAFHILGPSWGFVYPQFLRSFFLTHYIRFFILYFLRIWHSYIILLWLTLLLWYCYYYYYYNLLLLLFCSAYWTIKLFLQDSFSNSSFHFSFLLLGHQFLYHQLLRRPFRPS